MYCTAVFVVVYQYLVARNMCKKPSCINVIEVTRGIDYRLKGLMEGFTMGMGNIGLDTLVHNTIHLVYQYNISRTVTETTRTNTLQLPYWPAGPC